MNIDHAWLGSAVETELQTVTDARVAARIRDHIVEPEEIVRTYPLSTPKSEHRCSIVLIDPATARLIAYAPTGFGPRRPWGVLQADSISMGSDDDWHCMFLEAWLDAFPPTDLPIWRVCRIADRTLEFLSPRGAWKDQWEIANRLRHEQSAGYYTVDTEVFPRSRRGNLIMKSDDTLPP